ncbi:MAG: 50S ribosomal protein L21 [Candidatus Portnoybacteria bacterium]|nr:50S ribosomal protein L21 [Candidatus Portnoybacteria bacterium]MDD4983056.1 50S ribosomal protein L21 [Candidatus Portnoybacteria bacterium]
MELAVIKTGGKQYIVSPGQKLRVEKLKGEEGGKIVFDEVLLVLAGDKVQVGQPFIKGAKVNAKILKQDKADKVIIFKYKSKKREKVKRGHRQPYTLVEIEAEK